MGFGIWFGFGLGVAKKSKSGDFPLPPVLCGLSTHPPADPKLHALGQFHVTAPLPLGITWRAARWTRRVIISDQTSSQFENRILFFLFLTWFRGQLKAPLLYTLPVINLSTEKRHKRPNPDQKLQASLLQARKLCNHTTDQACGRKHSRE